MREVFDSLHFRYPWRPYQQRVLEAIDAHLDDNKLHIVAAPGAGKTTLGLEVFRRLRKPALVLSPTRIIRDQWLLRLKDFCESENPLMLDWVSNDIHQPAVLTSVTYQAIHSRVKSSISEAPVKADNIEDEENEELITLEEGVISDKDVAGFIESLRHNQIEVIILDEAHHLTSEWWKALNTVCEALPELTLVSLTATPPLDAQANDWARYESLCGPLDEEISVPELVQAGTLCPHQDYIWAVSATKREKQQIADYDKRVNTLFTTLSSDTTFQSIVESHPWLASEDSVGTYTSEIVKQPEIAISLLSFLKHRGLGLPVALLKTMDLKKEHIPELGRQQWQYLLESVLFSSTFLHTQEHLDYLKLLKRQLRAAELLRKRELSIVSSRFVQRSLSLSTAKIKACVDIHKIEFKRRGRELRQVILTDYIRDEAFDSGLEIGELNLGAWPVFANLIHGSSVATEIAMLSGRLSILAKQKLDGLESYLEENQMSCRPLPGYSNFVVLKGPLNEMTSLFTRLLIKGDICTLVGTKSLLGEGWDAPVVNSLVLASAVGTFMLTNQMRGRAIRIDKNNPSKVSAIWHLVAINTRSWTGWSDLFDLRKRFTTFVGLSEKDNTIESGFERMHARWLPLKFLQQQTVSTAVDPDIPIRLNNRAMLKRHGRIDSLGQRWQDALTLEGNGRVVPSVKTDRIPGLKTCIFERTFAALLAWFALIAGFAFQIAARVSNGQFSTFGVVFVAILGVFCLYNFSKTVALIRILFSHLPVGGSLKQIGYALAATLCQAGLITTSFRRIKVNVTKRQDGSYNVALGGSTFYESSLFADSLSEILAPIDNPRYLVVREGDFLGFIREDFHAVPVKLAVKKELAEMFYRNWCRYLGPGELIYTRTEAGKKSLLKAKMRAFSSNFKRDVEREDRWQS